jgi:hypothetical protein
VQRCFYDSCDRGFGRCQFRPDGLNLNQLRAVGVISQLPDQAAVLLALAVRRGDAGEERDEIGAELLRDLVAADEIHE